MKKTIFFGVLAVVFLGATIALWRNRALVSDGAYDQSWDGGVMTSSQKYDDGEMMRPSSIPEPTMMTLPGGAPMPGEFDKIGYAPTSEVYPLYPGYFQSLSYSLVTANPREFSSSFRSFVTSLGGKIESMSTSKGGRFASAYTTVVVPVARLSEVTDRINRDATEVIDESTYLNDRTGVLEQAELVVEELTLQKSLKEAELARATTALERGTAQVALSRINRQLLQANRNVEIAKSELENVSISLSIADNKRYFSGESSLMPGDQLSDAWYSFSRFMGKLLGGVIWIAVYSLLIVPAGIFAWLAVRSWRKARAQ